MRGDATRSLHVMFFNSRWPIFELNLNAMVVIPPLPYGDKNGAVLIRPKTP